MRLYYLLSRKLYCGLSACKPPSPPPPFVAWAPFERCRFCGRPPPPPPAAPPPQKAPPASGRGAKGTPLGDRSTGRTGPITLASSSFGSSPAASAAAASSAAASPAVCTAPSPRVPLSRRQDICCPPARGIPGAAAGAAPPGALAEAPPRLAGSGALDPPARTAWRLAPPSASLAAGKTAVSGAGAVSTGTEDAARPTPSLSGMTRSL